MVCVGLQSCARETRSPALASDSSQAAATHVTKPNRRPGFSPKPGRWVQPLLFISRWMGLNRLQAKAPLANPAFNASLWLLSSLTCGETATSKPDPTLGAESDRRHWFICNELQRNYNS